MSKTTLINKIVKVSINNLLSLKNIEVELGKLNVFVGPNANGKSNIVRAFQLMASMVRNGVPSLPGYNEFKDVVYGFDKSSEINLKIELDIQGRRVTYSLTLTADNYVERAWVNSKVALISEERRVTTEIFTLHGDLKVYHKPKELLSSNLYKNVYRSALTALPHNAAKELHMLTYILRNIAIHSFISDRLRLKSRVSTRPILGYYGENLARVLLHLYLEDRKAFSNIEEMIKNLIPEVEEVIPHIEGSDIEIWMRVKGLSEPLKPSNVSDGILRILAYITVLYSDTSLAILEEPEDCIHQHLLETMVDLARKAPSRIIMILHIHHTY